jgi:hypothetical protein
MFREVQGALAAVRKSRNYFATPCELCILRQEPSRPHDD